MAIDRSGEWWTGTDAADIGDYLRAHTEDGHAVTRVVNAACDGCKGDEFSVVLDDDEGCAVRTCSRCGRTTPMLDSAEYVDEADLGEAACPCGGERFNVAAGFAFHDDSDDVRWAYVGLRCVEDGVLGCYVDWKIDYSPSSQLVDQV